MEATARRALPLILLALAALSTRPGRSIVLGVVFLAPVPGAAVAAGILGRVWR